MLTQSPAPSTTASRGTIRVASVPAAHAYVDHHGPTGPVTAETAVLRLPDPVPRGPAPTGAGWWPPAMLEPAWVVAHRDDFDVFHIQFGFDARTPGQLAELIRALRDAGKPLVYTVHDLRNPHHPDRAEHDAQLDVLVPAADALITLTDGAADQVERRWRRRPLVLPHPHVVPFDAMRRARAHGDGPFTVGLHLKSLRACMDPAAVLPALLAAVALIPGGVLRVDGHTDVLAASGARYDAGLRELIDRAGDRIDLRVHDYFTDEELWAYLGSLDVSVLPYRFGTHSGWLEACRDLGTAVVAPSCGHYADQGPVHSYTMEESVFDAESLTDAVLAAHRAGPAAPVGVAQRRAQRDHIAAAHRELYTALLDRG